jgi:hypothetical protein
MIEDIGPGTFWQHLLLFAIFSDTQTYGTGFRKMFGETIEAFLQYGADPHVRISIPEEHHASAIESSVGTRVEDSSIEGIEITFGREEPKMVAMTHIPNPELQFIAKKGRESITSRVD